MGKRTLLLLAASVFVLYGCESVGPKTGTGAVAGGLIGATAGGIIGHQSGHGFEGAGIGAAVGALGGGLIGNSMDKRDQEAQAVNPNYITFPKIVEMAAQGTPDSVIISEIQRTHSVYSLNSEIIDYLKKNRVSDRVIDYMLETARK